MSAIVRSKAAQAAQIMRVVAADHQDEFTDAVAASAVIMNTFQVVKIETPSQLRCAKENLTLIDEVSNEIKKSRMAMTKPLDDVKAYLIDIEKGQLVLLNNAKDAIKSEMLAYDEREQARKAEQQPLVAASNAVSAFVSGECDLMASIDAHFEAVATIDDSERVKTRTQTVCEITDKIALLKWMIDNPQHLAMVEVNMVQLKKLARQTPVDGVLVSQTKKVTK